MPGGLIRTECGPAKRIGGSRRANRRWSKSWPFTASDRADQKGKATLQEAAAALLVPSSEACPSAYPVAAACLAAACPAAAACR